MFHFCVCVFACLNYYVDLLTSNRTIPEDPKRQNLSPPNPVDIPANVWHEGVNESNEPAHIIEVWKGAELTEDDIERQD